MAEVISEARFLLIFIALCHLLIDSICLSLDQSHNSLAKIFIQQLHILLSLQMSQHSAGIYAKPKRVQTFL